MDQGPHRRWDPLRAEWVLVSPHRTARPWQGQVEEPAPPVPEFDPHCYLCPGNTRAGGHQNPHYTGAYVFANDFAALLPELAAEATDQGDSLYQTQPVRGECHVICYSSRHDLSLGTLDHRARIEVIQTWQELERDLSSRYAWVQIFENRGAIMGASSPHPHGQVWAMDAIPALVERERYSQNEYWRNHQRPMLLDVVTRELADGTRVVASNADWLWLVPFWAVWPFEILLLPRFRVGRLSDLVPSQMESLSEILQEGLARYDSLFGVPFPYSMGWHGAPHPGGAEEGWQLHAHFYPPLLRSATVRKFMVGFELLAEAQRDLTPEDAAARLRQKG